MKILQLCPPAVPMWAVYEDNGKARFSPIVTLALTDDGIRVVDFSTEYLDVDTEDMSNYLGLSLSPDDVDDIWQKQIDRRKK